MRFSIGDFTFDPETGAIARGGITTRLRPQSAATLTLLAERPGRLVTRDELHRHVWPDTTVDYDLGLNTCISQVRAALGDESEAPRYIETLPRRGYRLIAPVSVEPDATDPAPTYPRRLRAILAGVFLALVAGLGVAALLQPPGPATFAIMPFQLPVPDSSLRFVQTALADDLIAGLAGADPDGLRVIARSSSFALARRGVAPLEAGRELSAHYVLDGAIRPVGGGYRVTAQLLEVGSGTYAWSAAFDVASPTPSGVLEDQVGFAIARAVSLELRPGLAPPAPAGRRAPGAIEALARARWVLDEPGPEAPGIAAAHAERAIRVDSTWGDAWATLAEVALRGGDLDRVTQLVATARRLDADPARLDLIEARTELFGRGRPAAALPKLRQALTRRPTADVRHTYALALAATGQQDRAAGEAREMLRLDPVSALARTDMGWVFLYADRPDEAERSCRSGLELTPRSVGARTCAVLAAASRGRLHRAADLLPPLLVELGADDSTAITLAALVSRGAPDSMWRWIERSSTAQTRMTSMDRARVAALSGRGDAAVRHLEEAARTGPAALLFVGVDPTFDPIRSRPDFQAIAGGNANRLDGAG